MNSSFPKQCVSESNRILRRKRLFVGQVALFRILFDAGVVGVVVGLFPEKVYGAGRKAATGFDVPAESLVRVGLVAWGVLRFVEEDKLSGV